MASACTPSSTPTACRTAVWIRTGANVALGQREDQRSYLVAAQMLEALGESRVALLSNNPDKARQLARFGMTVTARVATGVHLSAANARYRHQGGGRAHTRWTSRSRQDEVLAAAGSQGRISMSACSTVTSSFASASRLGQPPAGCRHRFHGPARAAARTRPRPTRRTTSAASSDCARRRGGATPGCRTDADRCPSRANSSAVIPRRRPGRAAGPARSSGAGGYRMRPATRPSSRMSVGVNRSTRGRSDRQRQESWTSDARTDADPAWTAPLRSAGPAAPRR